jgi:glutathione peroxidase-family protein
VTGSPGLSVSHSTGSATLNDEPEFAPIIERNLDFFDFSMKTPDGRAFNLREYAAGSRLVIVAFVAGWCKNSNENGHVVKRLYDKFKTHGLGVVVVTEYSDRSDVTTHINRIGIDYPVVTETDSQQHRKRSLHYKYRKAVGDKRKWGTPFYVLIDTRKILPDSGQRVLARTVFTVSGELIEQEARSFIEKRLIESQPSD